MAESQVVCPYEQCNESVDARELYFHLLQCRRASIIHVQYFCVLFEMYVHLFQNYTGHLVQCPYDASHAIPAVEMELHVSMCPTRGFVEMVQGALIRFWRFTIFITNCRF